MIFLFLSESFSEEGKIPIVVDGDKVEFFGKTKEIQAEGNVIITYQDLTLFCDKIRVNTETKDALAEGNVYIRSSKGEIRGEKVEYNFENKVGRIVKGDISSEPFYGKGELINRISEQEFQIHRGYITTCDLVPPHYRFQAKKIELFPEDKVIARNVVLKIGDVPIFWIPRFVQRLDENRPHVRLVPGKNKDWGYFLLQAWRYNFNPLMHGRLYLDYREKKDFAWGWDNQFDTPLLGKGLFRVYYMNERNIQSKHLWDIPRNTKEKERFRIQLLQSKQFSDDTRMILQFNRMSDDKFVKDYFFREYEKDYKPDSYLLLTQTKPYYSLNFLLRKRFNRYFAETEKLPEITLDIPSYKLGETYFYFNNSTSSSIMEKKGAAPSDLKQKIYRFDTYNELARQKKIAFIETKPYIAYRGTYFSKDVNWKKDIWRNIFYAGIDLSTKFYRMFDISCETLFLKIHNLRHIITPSISYAYIRKPDIISSRLIQYDDIDSIDKQSSLSLSLENKLQTKRESKTVDFLRFIVDTSYIFKHQQESGGNFSNINTDLELLPQDWIRIDVDSVYDRGIKKFSSVNFDLYLHDTSKPERWSIGIGKRFERKDSNQITTELKFRPNNKWNFRIYERFYPHSDNLMEQEYTIVKDLHCWELEVNYNVRRGWGETIWFIFRLKAFPDIEFDWNKEYHRRKPGSQSE
jgi:LPS-assembly protein